MKNKSFLFAIVAILILVSLFLTTIYKKDQVENRQLDQREQLIVDLDKLVALYKNDKIDAIDISTITPFKWEKLYFFSPYSTAEQIFATLGFSDDIKSFISYDDGIILFIFVKENKVVQYMDYPRNPDFNSVVRELGYSPSEAIFVLDNEGVVVKK
jgi:ABC-type amino acid transport substrate-binding protein